MKCLGVGVTIRTDFLPLRFTRREGHCSARYTGHENWWYTHAWIMAIVHEPMVPLRLDRPVKVLQWLHKLELIPVRVNSYMQSSQWKSSPPSLSHPQTTLPSKASSQPSLPFRHPGDTRIFWILGHHLHPGLPILVAAD